MPNTKELFKRYAIISKGIFSTDSPLEQDLLMSFDGFNKAIGEIISLPVEPPVKPACGKCKYVYNDKDIEQILYCRNPKFAEYVSVVFGGCDGSISVNENFGCIDFESKSV